MQRLTDRIVVLGTYLRAFTLTAIDRIRSWIRGEVL